ncbi:MAG: T9SS type A sorting domain-containing protein [Bacteroidales bacterium]|nr:T9SS type A sorting domain-containing protein [Bacteroidales bacterium]
MKLGNLILTCLLMALAVPCGAQQSKRVLFVGNSYTYVNDLPQMISAVAQSMGDNVEASSNTPGGCTFMQHCSNQSMTMICQGNWDIVVLQEQSQYPSFPQEQVENEVFPYAQRLVDSVYANSPCAEPMFYMTWGRENGDQYNAQFFPVLGTYEGMDSMLYVRYMYMAEANDASVCPVGRVWRRLRSDYSHIGLYQSDGSHPSVEGSYAAACAFYVMFFHRDPMQITYNPGIDDNVASTIRSVVRSVVFDQLPLWCRTSPHAGFVVDRVENEEACFTSTATLADKVMWDFGDGTIVEGNSQQVCHTYQASGTYTVAQMASRHCVTDTMTMTVNVVVTDTVPDDTTAAAVALGQGTIRLFPNPTMDETMLTVPDGMAAMVELTDVEGRRITSFQMQETERMLHMEHLPSGVYLLRITTHQGTVVKRIIKR